MRKAAKKLQELFRKNTFCEGNKCDIDKNFKDWVREEFRLFKYDTKED